MSQADGEAASALIEDSLKVGRDLGDIWRTSTQSAGLSKRLISRSFCYLAS
jgi:hypothetical protein